MRAIIAGVLMADGEAQLLRDWEILKWLNSLSVRKAAFGASSQGPVARRRRGTIDRALQTIRARLPDLEHGFQQPETEVSPLVLAIVTRC